MELAHKPLFIPESKTVRDLLDDLKRSGMHLAVIIDEYGGTAGIITIEDIVEQIVGDIRDEYDSDEDTTPKPVPQPDGSFIFDGRALISEVNDLLGVEISENEDANTIGGFVCAELGRIPESGELCLLPGQLSATIIKADRKKIISLKLKPEGSKTNV